MRSNTESHTLLLIDSKGVPHKSGPDSCSGPRPDLCGTPLLSISNKVCDSVLLRIAVRA